jgi:hypothetical protein
VRALLYTHLTSKLLSPSLGGDAFTFEPIIQGEDITLAFRFADEIQGNSLEVSRVVRNWKASIGRVDARPTGGHTKLKIGTATSVAGTNVTTDAVPYNVAEGDLKTALEALSVLTSPQKPLTVTKVNDTYKVVCANGAQLVIAAVENELTPLSFVNVGGRMVDGKWVHELRFIQTPVCFSSTQTRLLPLAPVISQFRAGGTADGSSWNEVQKVEFKPGFNGGVIFTRGSRQSAPFEPAVDGPTELQTKLNVIADSKGSFLVTQPFGTTLHIEFQGSMAGQSQSLLGLTIVDFREGDLTCTVSTKTAELDEILRNAPENQITLPLEVTCELQDEHDDTVWHPATILRQDVTIRQTLNRDELGVLEPIDWLVPLSATSYLLFDPDNIVTTTQSYVTTLGNGTLHIFTVTHGLGTTALNAPQLVDNHDGGRVLVNGTDYTAEILDANTIRFTIAGTAPTAGSIGCTISSAGPITTFLNAIEITIDQVTGLSAALTALGERVSTVEAALAITGGSTTTQTADPQPSMIQPIAKVAKLLPWGRNDQLAITDLGAVDTSKLRSLGLLNAVHAASVTAIPAGPPEPNVSYRGIVYQNQTGADIQLTGGSGHKAPIIKPNGYALCNGLIWYAATRYGTEKTYYPTDFELTLMPPLVIDGDELTVGSTLSLDFGLQLAAFRANTNASWVLEIRHGLPTSETSPSGVGANLKNITWNATPIYSKQLILTAEPRTRLYNLSIARSLVVTDGTPTDTLTTSVKHGNIKGGTTGPSAASSFGAGKPFVVGIFLCRGDFEDTNPDMRGFVGVVFPSPPNVAGTTNATLGQAIIQPS